MTEAINQVLGRNQVNMDKECQTDNELSLDDLAFSLKG